MNVNVSLPSPPSTGSEPPDVLKSVNVLTTIESLPAPAEILSIPALPVSWSAPAPPEMMSLPAPPVIVSAPPLPVKLSGAAPPLMLSPKAPPRTVTTSVTRLFVASTVSLSPPVNVVGCISRSVPSIVSAVPVNPALTVIVAVITVPEPPPSSRATSRILTVSTFVICASKTAVVLTPTPACGVASTISTIIWSSPAPPLTLSRAVNVSVA